MPEAHGGMTGPDSTPGRGGGKRSTRKCIGKFRISSCFSRIVFVVAVAVAMTMSTFHVSSFHALFPKRDEVGLSKNTSAAG